MNKEIIENISKDLNVKEVQVEKTLKLLEEGNTIPFIARYRKEVTGNLDEEQIRKINEVYEYEVNLLKRKEDVWGWNILFPALSADSGLNRQLEAQRTKLRDKLKATDEKLAIKQKGPQKTISPKKLKIGDGVKVLTLGLKGTVSTLPNAKGDLFVQMGILRSQVNINDLEYLGEAEHPVSGKGSSGSGNIKMSKSASVSTEINLIGMTVDEAMGHLDKYLDDAYLAHVPSVRIVHGKGTGALRSAVHQHLKRCKYIKSYRLGTFGEGEAGVTIAEFK